MQKSLGDFMKAVDIEVEKAEKNYNVARKAAEEVSAAASLSPSQSGDRFHSQGTADMMKQKLDRILALKKEIEEKREKICFEYKNKMVYIVENPVIIPGFEIISSKSPQGCKLFLKRNKNTST